MKASSMTYRVIQDISRIMNIKMYADWRLKNIISGYARKRGYTLDEAVDQMYLELKEAIK